MSETGMLVKGRVVPGTDWIRRDPAYFFDKGRGTRPRAKLVDLLVGHWTGGEAGLYDPDGPRGPKSPYDDDGPFIVNVMRNRKRPDGTPLNVGIHFVIGACDPGDVLAPVWQTADPGLTATVHVGKGFVNARSIGVEVVSCGVPGANDRRSRPTKKMPLLGKMQTVSRFYQGQLNAWVDLANTLAALDGLAGIRIPRQVPSFGGNRRLSLAEARKWAGAMEHLHVPGTTKKDAGGMLLEALAGDGWSIVVP